MNRPAHITSIDALEELRTALLKFEAGARDAITVLQLEVRRAVDWIEHDRRRYWPEQAKLASERLVEARSELERCQLRYGSEEAPSCYEQKKKVERAKRRLRYCEEQVRRVKHWIRALRQELIEFEGQMAQMTNCLDADIPRGAAALARMLSALERYTETRSTAAPTTPFPVGTSSAGTAPLEPSATPAPEPGEDQEPAG